jgi:hypothetical protein
MRPLRHEAQPTDRTIPLDSSISRGPSARRVRRVRRVLDAAAPARSTCPHPHDECLLATQASKCVAVVHLHPTDAPLTWHSGGGGGFTACRVCIVTGKDKSIRRWLRFTEVLEKPCSRAAHSWA